MLIPTEKTYLNNHANHGNPHEMMIYIAESIFNATVVEIEFKEVREAQIVFSILIEDGCIVGRVLRPARYTSMENQLIHLKEIKSMTVFDGNVKPSLIDR